MSIAVHFGIAAATTAALTTAAIVTNGLIAFGIGATAPTVVKKMAKYVETLLPPDIREEQEQERGDEDGT